MKKFIAAILCAIIFITVVSGCNQTSPPDYMYEEQEEGLPAGDDVTESPDSSEFSFDAAFATFPPDAVIMRAGGFDVTWGEFFFFLRDNVKYLLSVYGEITDWSDSYFDDMTLSESVMRATEENVLLFKAVQFGAELNDVTLSEDDLRAIRDDFDQTAEYLGGEEEFLKLLWEQDGFHNRELLEYLMSISMLADNLFIRLYGEGGMLLSDDDVSLMTFSDGYLIAKHILRQNTEESEDAALAEIEDILAQLDAYNGDDFDAFFDELMFTHSADTAGLMQFPEGYLFQYGNMVQSFYEATVALEIGDYSRAVESEHGYHIVYRLPINYDSVPNSLYMYGDYRTLRHYMAYILFEMTMQGWQYDLDPEYTADYDLIDLSVMFAGAS